MSVSRLVTIECDSNDCSRQFVSTTDDFDEAVDQAAKVGWTRDDDADTDFCNAHPSSPLWRK